MSDALATWTRAISNTLFEIEALCPDTAYQLYSRWSDVIRAGFGDPGFTATNGDFNRCRSALERALRELEEEHA